MIVNNKTVHKAFQIPPLPLPVSEKTESYYIDELRTIWQRSDRDWSIFSKKNMEEGNF